MRQSMLVRAMTYSNSSYAHADAEFSLRLTGSVDINGAAQSISSSFTHAQYLGANLYSIESGAGNTHTHDGPARRPLVLF